MYILKEDCSKQIQYCEDLFGEWLEADEGDPHSKEDCVYKDIVFIPYGALIADVIHTHRNHVEVIHE